jgi:hypothetical protein
MTGRSLRYATSETICFMVCRPKLSTLSSFVTEPHYIPTTQYSKGMYDTGCQTILKLNWVPSILGLKIAVFTRRVGLLKPLWPSAPHYYVFYRLPSSHSLRHQLDLLPTLHKCLLLLFCAFFFQPLSDPYFRNYCESLTSINHTNSQLKGCATLFELCQTADFLSPSKGMSGL